MSGYYPPGVTGNEPQIAGYPETPETALADVLSDERVYGGFDTDEVTGWNVDKTAASLIKRLAERGVVLVDTDSLARALVLAEVKRESLTAYGFQRSVDDLRPKATRIMSHLGVKGG